MLTPSTRRIIFFLALLAPAFSAPKPDCIESCLIQRLASLRNSAQHLDYSRPGNWSEHNQYSLDGGQGRVHQEHGQYIDSSKQIRYFKKNYSSSSFDNNDAAEASLSANHFGNFNSQRLTSHRDAFESRRHPLGTNQPLGYVQSQSQQLHSFHSSQDAAIDELKRLMAASQESFRHQSSSNSRLEDLSHSESIADQNHIIRTKPKKEEQAFEEHGQIQNGPTHVKYYKSNYSSNYSSGLLVPVTGLIHSRPVDSLDRDTEVAGSLLHANQETRRTESHLAENSQFQSQYAPHLANYGSGYQARDSQRQYQGINRNPVNYIPDYAVNSASLVNSGSAVNSGSLEASESSRHEPSRFPEVPVTGSHQSYRGAYGSNGVQEQRASGSLTLEGQRSEHSSGQYQSSTHGQNSYQQVQYPQHTGYPSHSYGGRRKESSGEYGSLREEVAGSVGQLNENQYTSPVETVVGGNRNLAREYEEHHSHASHYKESTVPHQGAGEILQQQRLAHQQADSQHGGAAWSQRSGYAHHSSYFKESGNTYVGQAGSGYGQLFGAPNEKLVVGALDLGHHDGKGVKCTHKGAGHIQHSSQYHSS